MQKPTTHSSATDAVVRRPITTFLPTGSSSAIVTNFEPLRHMPPPADICLDYYLSFRKWMVGEHRNVAIDEGRLWLGR